MTHHTRVPHRLSLKKLHVCRVMPGQPAALADGIVLIYRYDAYDGHDVSIERLRNPVATVPGSVVACFVQQPGRYRSRFCLAWRDQCPMSNVKSQMENDYRSRF